MRKLLLQIIIMKLKITFFILFAALNTFAQNKTNIVNCDLTFERTLQTFNVYIHNPSGATMYRAKFYIDADGSPRAYGPNNSGLDYTANAGSTGNWYGVVADASGTNPILQTASDPYPGMYVSTTSLVNSNYGINNPLRYVNSETVPYIACPTNVLSSGGIQKGDIVYVYNTTTGQSCFAIYADAGNTTSIGEGSIYLASHVGVNPNVRTGGTSLGIIDYIIFPHSGYGQGYIPTIAQIDSIGNICLNAANVGGPCIVSCLGSMYDNTPPVTAISVPAGWDTTNFVASFTDTDNGCIGGVEKSFYNVSDYNGTEWRANSLQGFMNDNFDQSTINSEWTQSTGTWIINSNSRLEQNNENLANTNIYAPLTQNLSNRYLYHFNGILSGSGTNRRAGFHFFADAPDSTNRGNSYFVWFRLDDDKIQVYEVVNNSWGANPVKDTTYNFTANQSYDFKITYDRITGLIRVYINDVRACVWIDTTPLSTGTHISFRTANCKMQIDNFEVFRTRQPTSTITVGSANTNKIRYQNPNPATPAGRIKSVVTDAMGNISTIVSEYINVDWTHPTAASLLNDGTANDIDTTNNGSQLDANWTVSADANSGVNKYYYSIGTTAGASDVLSWTTTPISTTNLSATGLTLISGQLYFISVQAENDAGMRSAVSTSNGQAYYDIATKLSDMNVGINVLVFPNPSNGIFNIQLKNAVNASIIITDALGRIVNSGINKSPDSVYQLNISNEPAGIYCINVITDAGQYSTKVLLNK